MKRISLVFLCFVLLFTTLSFPALAEGKGKISLSGEVEGLSRGDPFEVFLELNRNPGLASLLVTLHFDPQVLEFQSAADPALLPGFAMTPPDEKGDLILRWRAPEGEGDLTAAGNLCKLIFRVKDDAPLGETLLEPRINSRFFDAQNSLGEAVVFDVEALTAKLPCYHVKQEITVLSQPSFETAGTGTVVCRDCGETWEEEILPTLASADGSTFATLQPGEYLDADEKGLRTDYLYGGTPVEEAKSLFGDALIRAFRISFIKNESVFDPKGKTAVQLTLEFEVPERFVLFAIENGEAKKVDARQEKGVLYFNYAPGLLVLGTRSPGTPPETSPTTTTSPATSSQAPVEISSRTPSEGPGRQDLIYLAAGALAVVIFGTGAVILLRGGKKY
ncbi:MAG: hypothetical protein IKJ74_03505 [Clostridia bacterium]|nr:hypothetical protein [Clostridia bacterium]